VCFLEGGLVALNNPGGSVQICTGQRSAVLTSFDIERFIDLYSQLWRRGHAVVGCEFYQTPDELRGIDPAQFRVFEPRIGWRCYDTGTSFRQIANAAMKLDQMALADCAARVAFELQAVEFRVLELCRAYSTQLRGCVSRGEISARRRFSDLNTRAVIHAIHALFYELAVLRDYIADFVAGHILRLESRKGTPIHSMSGLRKALKGKVTDDPLVSAILAGTSTPEEGNAPGWLAVLSAYRNVFAHLAPLSLAGRGSWAIQDLLATMGSTLPILYYPLPRNPIDLERSRSKGVPFERFEDWLNASAEHQPRRDEEPDALQYLHASTNRMATLASELVKRSPVAPTPIVLTEADLIGPVVVQGGD
jgi:hypothetical protein